MLIEFTKIVPDTGSVLPVAENILLVSWFKAKFQYVDEELFSHSSSHTFSIFCI